MEFKVLNNDQIDKKQWDLDLKALQNPFLYLESWYLDIVSPGWRAIISHSPKALMALPNTKPLFKLSRCIQPVFTQQLGYIGTLPTTIFEKAIRLYDVVHFYGNAKMPESSNYEYRRNYILSLKQPYNAIKTRYSPKLKARLRKSGVSVKDISLIDGIRFYQAEAANRFNLSAAAAKQMETICLAAQRQSKLYLKAAFLGEEVIGVIICLYSEMRVVNLFSISNELGRKNFAMAKLLDHSICAHVDQKEHFDFEGSTIEGVAHFYRKFSPTEELYPVIQRYNSALAKAMYTAKERLKL